MKRYTFVLPALAFICLLFNAILGQSGAAAGFDKLKSLAGEWQAILSDGKVHKVLYQIASGGSALVETLMPPDEPSMMSIYHVDGDKLVMTHYCSAGNQPRMRAVVTGTDIKSLNFKFVGATNLAKSSDGHMHGLTITFKDKDQIRHTWTWREGGKEMMSVFEFARKVETDKK